PLADRGQLRRARLDVRRSDDGLVRRLRDTQLLPRAPHHDGRRRSGPHESSAAEAAARVVSRLGTRLLVRAGRGRHVRQAVRLEARSSAPRLRPQVHLLARRLQPEGHGLAGGNRRRTARQARVVRRDAQAQLAVPARRPRAVRGPVRAAARDRAQRPELVRLPADGSRDRAVRPSRPDRPPREPQGRDAVVVRRQPDPPARVRGSRVPDGRWAAEQRRRDGALVLDRRLSRPDRGDARVRRVGVRALRPRPPVTTSPDAAAFFGDWVALYDARYDERSADGHALRARMEVVLGLLGRGPGAVLDAGMGPGRLGAELAARGWTVSGVDAAEEMVEVARKRLAEAAERLVHAELESLPFPDASFDAV